MDIVENKMRKYIDFCKEEDEYQKPRGDSYSDYCNDFGYVRSRIKTADVTRKELKIYFDFKNCDHEKIIKRMSTEVSDGFFSGIIDGVQLSNGEYVLIFHDATE